MWRAALKSTLVISLLAPLPALARSPAMNTKTFLCKKQCTRDCGQQKRACGKACARNRACLRSCSLKYRTCRFSCPKKCGDRIGAFLQSCQVRCDSSCRHTGLAARSRCRNRCRSACHQSAGRLAPVARPPGGKGAKPPPQKAEETSLGALSSSLLSIAKKLSARGRLFEPWARELRRVAGVLDRRSRSESSGKGRPQSGPRPPRGSSATVCPVDQHLRGQQRRCHCPAGTQRIKIPGGYQLCHRGTLPLCRVNVRFKNDERCRCPEGSKITSNATGAMCMLGEAPLCPPLTYVSAARYCRCPEGQRKYRRAGRGYMCQTPPRCPVGRRFFSKMVGDVFFKRECACPKGMKLVEKHAYGRYYFECER